MTPAARLAAVIALITEMDSTPRRPADAVASEFFRQRRFIGSADRREISSRTWRIVRRTRRIGWHIKRQNGEPTPRLLVAASIAFEGRGLSEIEALFSGAEFAPPPLKGADLKLIRGLCEQKLTEDTMEQPGMPPAVRLEVPDWLYPKLEKQYGDRLVAELEALSEPAPLDLRVNTLRGDRDQARISLAAEGYTAVITPLCPWGLRLPPRQSIVISQTFQQGLVEVQDEGSQLVSLLVDAQPGQRVLDWCAGAGGKTLALAACMKNRGHIAACDVSTARLEGAVKRLKRAGVHNVERHLVRAGDKWAKRRIEGFDRVLVDAPCTGSGTWRRNPDARLRLRKIDLDELLPKQREILEAAATMVRPGGKLIYATCSMLAEENIEQIEGFLSRHPAFHLVPASDTLPVLAEYSDDGMTLNLSPHRGGTDGFFAAVMMRKHKPAPPPNLIPEEYR